MPIYEYLCPNSHWQEVFIRIDKQIPASVQCEDCGEEATKQLSTFTAKMGEYGIQSTNNWRRERVCPDGHTYDGSYFGNYCPRCRKTHKITMGGEPPPGVEAGVMEKAAVAV